MHKKALRNQICEVVHHIRRASEAYRAAYIGDPRHAKNSCSSDSALGCNTAIAAIADGGQHMQFALHSALGLSCTLQLLVASEQGQIEETHRSCSASVF